MSLAYAAWVLTGIVAAAFVRRALPIEEYPHRRAIAVVAGIGALGGALAFEVPADVFGWTSGADGALVAGRLGGRTVLGGILGGWIAVEAVKPALGVRVPTGDGFAAPLAVALAFGRMGCWSAGCCAGSVCDVGAWGCVAASASGVARWPVQAVEAVFHGAAALVLIALTRGRMFPGRLLAAYVAVYAMARFGLEALRTNPPVMLGLTYYQVLAIPLFALAVSVLVRRTLGGVPVSLDAGANAR